MRLTWKDGDSTSLVGAAATLMAATGVFWLAAVIRYAPMAALRRRDAVPHTR